MPTLCIFETRASLVTPLRLLVLSLRAHGCTFPTRLFYTAADDEFADWISQFPNVQLHRTTPVAAEGWDTKPTLLRHLLRDEEHDVVWLDSDILVAAPIDALFMGIPEDVFVGTEEFCWAKHQGSVIRTRGWGLEVGRDIPVTINSGVLRATRRHLGLLDRWAELLKDERYIEASKLDWQRRPMHLLTDQDVLTAVLGSKEFADIPLAFLQRGRDIAQCINADGFTIGERLACIARPPYFYHAQRPKPWDNTRARFRADLVVSPYAAEARKYRDQLPNDDTAWMDLQTPVTRLLQRCLPHPVFQGALYTLAQTVSHPKSVAGRILVRGPQRALDAVVRGRTRGPFLRDIARTADGDSPHE